MRIHTVKEGDTIFKIARLYSLPPAKIIENNALATPDRLYPGQKLLILTPTRSYTVRGGDTLGNIAKRFGTDELTLKRNNPALMGEERIYPGQILAIKYDAKRFGNAVLNGYFTKDCTKEKLSLFLPYLTYITLAAAKWENSNLTRLFDCKTIISKAKDAGVNPILRIYTENSPRELIKERVPFLNSVIPFAKKEGFYGISLVANKAIKESDEFKKYFKELKDELKTSELELHTEFDGNADINRFKEVSEIADLTILNYEKGDSMPVADFKSGEEKLLKDFSYACNNKNCLVDLSDSSYLGGESVDFYELEKLIRTRGIKPQYSEDTKCCHFAINRYSGGKREEVFASFAAPENTKAKLELLGELDFMGVSFDIERTPVYRLMMFNSFFNAEKALSGSGCCQYED